MDLKDDIAGLASPDPRRRIPAEDRLRDAGAEAVRALREAVADPATAEPVQRRAADLLGWILHDGAVEAFRRATPAPELIDVWAGAVAIAAERHADLDPVGADRRLEEIVAGARDVVPAEASVADRAVRLTAYLHGELGFRGDDVTYGDLRNSYLPDVLDRRRGIPVTLAIVWMAVANRLGLRSAGVGLPLHFVARCETGDGPVFVDAFYGALLDEEGCRRLVARAAGRDVSLPASAFRPLRPEEVLARMLRNLRSTHERAGRLHMALASVDRLLHLQPLEVAALRDRAILMARLGRPTAAARALSRALALLPEGPERERLTEVRGRLQREAAQRN